MKLVGHLDTISHSGVVGWVADTENLKQSLTILVTVDGVEHARVRADQPRPGLVSVLGQEATGDYQLRIDFEPRLSVFRPHRIAVTILEAPSVKLPGFSHNLAAPAPVPWSLVPLVVTSLGRSGTTLLMSEFVSHPGIVTPDRYPYEIKLIAYYASAFRALASNEDRQRSTNPDTFFKREQRYRIGHNPYYNNGHYSLIKDRQRLRQYFEADTPARIAAVFRENIKQFYDLIREDQGKATATYFAEKGDLDEAAREGVRMFFGPVKEVVLVRDPRDLMCSARAFWKMSSQEAMSMLATSLPRLEEIRRAGWHDVFVLRYEDLILHPRTSRNALGRFLDIDIPPPVASDTPAGHATSRNPRASLNRWREDLSAAEIAECERRFAGYMAMFGYESCAGPKRATARVMTTHASRATLGATFAYSGAVKGETVVDVDYTSGNAARDFLAEGWSGIERAGVWTCAPSATLRIGIPADLARATVVLIGHPFVAPDVLPRQRIGVTIDGVDFGEAELFQVGRLEFAVEPTKTTLEVCLRLPDSRRPTDLKLISKDDRQLGFCLERLAIVRPATYVSPAARPAADGAELPARELMERFLSLGENCEFGLVQRKCGAEPADLLRFSSSPLPRLLRALRARFEDVARPENLVVELSKDGREYMVLDRAYGFYHHAWVLAGQATPEAIYKREVERLPGVIETMIRDLTEARRVCVYHSNTPLGTAQVVELIEALHAYGPVTLLWMETADADHPGGSVERLGPYLLKGYLDRFAPPDDAPAFSLDGWMRVIRNAHGLYSIREAA